MTDHISGQELYFAATPREAATIELALTQLGYEEYKTSDHTTSDGTRGIMFRCAFTDDLEFGMACEKIRQEYSTNADQYTKEIIDNRAKHWSLENPFKR